jgi:hypothetical protein
MTHDDDDVTVPGDDEVIAELRRRAALDAAGEGAGAPAVPNRASTSERGDLNEAIWRPTTPSTSPTMTSPWRRTLR